MPSMSRTTIMGHLGQDPEVRFTGNGNAMCTFTVATTDKWKDKQSGEWKEKTEWHRCTLWGKQAERAGEWLHKGSGVYLEGQNETRKWQDKDGNDRYTTEIKVRTFMPLDKKPQETKTQPGPAIDDDIPF